MRARRQNCNDSRCKGKPFSAVAKPHPTLLATALQLALGIATSAHAANFVVSDVGDSGPGTLRQAVLDANGSSGPHTITFDLTGGSTIGLTSGDIQFTGPDVTIQGTGQDALIISGNHSSRIFDVQAGNITINDLTLRDGLAQGDATNFEDEVGGAIRVGALPTFRTPAEFSVELARAYRDARLRRVAFGPRDTHRMSALRSLQTLSNSTITGIPAPGLTLDHVSLLDNRADAPALASGGAVGATGGAMLVIRNSLFSGNSSSWIGGAIFSLGGNDVYTLPGAGSFDIADTVIIGNHVDQNGGGPSGGQGAGIIMFGPGGSIRRSTVRDNVINDAPLDLELSDGIGGGIALGVFDGLPIAITDSEISGNTIALRPGVYAEGAGLYCKAYYGATPLTVGNTTISGNYSQHGAGIESGCFLQLVNSTVAGNIAPDTTVPGSTGGGDAVEMVYDVGIFNASSTLIANSDARRDLYLFETDELGTVTKSLIVTPDPSVPPLPVDTIIGVDPLLSALANNGGPTRTHALLPGSVAIDAGENVEALVTDQRGSGFARMIGAQTDIGAFESDPDRILTNGFE